jgi:hypothetical protein
MSIVSSGSTGEPKPTDLTNPTDTESNKIAGTHDPDSKGSQPSKDASSKPVLPAQGKVEGSTPPSQPDQDNPVPPSSKKMTAEQRGAKLVVSKHQEMVAKKAKTQEFIRPESLKERLIREGKSHPDPKDPKFAQYFKEKAIKSTHQEGNTSGNNEGERKLERQC